MEEMDLATYRAQFAKPQRAAYTASEAGEQQALFQWIETVTPREPRLAYAFHVPNGGLRNRGVAGQLKAQGVRPGVPDLLLPVASREFVGAALELKVKGGVIADEQYTWLSHFYSQRWAVCAAYGWLEAARWLCWYLEREPVDMGLAL